MYHQQQQQQQLKQREEGGAGAARYSPAAKESGGPLKALLRCHACSKQLEYDAGAQYVQCYHCSTMNAVAAHATVGGKVLSMYCPVCHTTNLAPFGINYVRCASCVTISQVSSSSDKCVSQ